MFKNLKFTRQHITGITLSASSILGLITTAVKWVTTNVTATGNTVCATNVPPVIVGFVVTGLGVLGAAGAFLLLIAPSISQPANVAAGESAKLAMAKAA
jgi:hypothetical protein